MGERESGEGWRDWVEHVTSMLYLAWLWRRVRILFRDFVSRMYVVELLPNTVA